MLRRERCHPVSLASARYLEYRQPRVDSTYDQVAMLASDSLSFPIDCGGAATKITEPSASNNHGDSTPGPTASGGSRRSLVGRWRNPSHGSFSPMYRPEPSTAPGARGPFTFTAQVKRHAGIMASSSVAPLFPRPAIGTVSPLPPGVTGTAYLRCPVRAERRLINGRQSWRAHRRPPLTLPPGAIGGKPPAPGHATFTVQPGSAPVLSIQRRPSP
jgi:hypothetical protein